MKEFIVDYDIDLKKYNTYRIGGKAKYLIKPNDVFDVVDLIDDLNKNNVKYYVLGGGSNVILPDEDFDGAIINLDKINDFYLKDDLLFAGAGLSLSSFVKKTLDYEFVNLANLFGIPGTLGGAIIGNAGAYGMCIFDFLVSVLIYQDGAIKLINKENINYSYRYTEFKNANLIVLGGVFKLQKGDASKAWDTINKNLELRKSKQPLEYPSAGSVFKNPEGQSAGFLIEKSGLKGYKVNDAQVSLKHANFIINLQNAKSCDIKKLINIIKEKVKSESGTLLELEQIIVEW